MYRNMNSKINLLLLYSSIINIWKNQLSKINRLIDYFIQNYFSYAMHFPSNSNWTPSFTATYSITWYSRLLYSRTVTFFFYRYINICLILNAHLNGSRLIKSFSEIWSFIISGPKSCCVNERTCGLNLCVFKCEGLSWGYVGLLMAVHIIMLHLDYILKAHGLLPRQNYHNS